MVLNWRLSCGIRTVESTSGNLAGQFWTLTERFRKQLNIFERKVYRRILGPVCDNKKKLEDIN
jgi:hypothetical protein